MIKNEFVMIYGLYDPRNDELRYIGKATNFEESLIQHIHKAKKGDESHRSSWVRVLLDLGMIPSIKLLGYSTVNSWQEDEKAWIAKMKKKGASLTNHTDGGDGIPNYRHSNETKRKISNYNKKVGRIPPSWKGRKQSPEHIRKRVEARKRKGNYKHSDEIKKKIGENRRGKGLGNSNSLGYIHTDEWKKAQSKRFSGENNPFFGRTHTKESKEKISNAKKGKDG